MIAPFNQKRTVLFITRKFPPHIGGMEKVAYDLHRYLSETANIELVKWGGSNKWLYLILPLLFLHSIAILIFKKVDVIYLQDGLLTSIGIFLKPFGKPIAVTIHGTDIIFDSKAYQFIVPRCVKRMDRIICISRATKHECLNRGIPEEKISIIPNGISGDFCISVDPQLIIPKLSGCLGIDLNNRKILLSVGRIVEHKGYHWFTSNVVPELVNKHGNIVYLIAGSGDFKERINEVIIANSLQKNVFLLGKVDDETLQSLYGLSHIFIMPNIPIEGIMEGFGVVILEATSCGLPVVASNLQGIGDAVTKGENGFLVEPFDTQGFIATIEHLLQNENERKAFGMNARKFTLAHYGWDHITELYQEALDI